MRGRRAPLAVAALAAILLLAGCATNPDAETTKESTIPWGRPATWEGQLPGMGR